MSGLALGTAISTAGLSQAETLPDAIALAYQSNPMLQSDRAQLRALDESYVQARAGYRATASLQVEPSYSRLPQTTLFGGTTEVDANSGGVSLQLNQPLYTGGRVSSAVRAAEGDIAAGREALRDAEAQVVQSVIQAYEDVRRDEQIVIVREADVSTLRGQVDDALARRKAGEVTRTDVEQSQAQMEGSQALLDLARGQLQTSRAEYVAAVGQNPGALALEPPLPGLPISPEEAFSTAEADSAVLHRAQLTERASGARIAEARAANMPTATLSTSLSYNGVLQPFFANRYERSFTAGVIFTQPILTGGVNASNIRRAIDLNNSDRIAVEGARRQVVQLVSQAFSQTLANRLAARASEREVDAAQKYFDDTQTEYRIGQRSTLDVLIAEQTLRDARIAQLQATHDTYLAEAELLNAMGRLEVRFLVKDVPAYSPKAAFKRVANAGFEPWEVLVAALDTVGSPGRGSRPTLPAPRAAAAPVALEGPPIPEAAAFPPADPTNPLAGTTSPLTPRRLDTAGVP